MRQREKNRLKKETQKERDMQRAHAAAATLIPTLHHEEDTQTLQLALHQASSIRGHVPALDAEAVVAQERLVQLQLQAQAECKAEEHLQHYNEVQQLELLAATDAKEATGRIKMAATDEHSRAQKQCVVCLDGENTHIIFPCGHKYACKACSDKIMGHGKLCPMCRQEISVVYHVFG